MSGQFFRGDLVLNEYQRARMAISDSVSVDFQRPSSSFTANGQDEYIWVDLNALKKSPYIATSIAESLTPVIANEQIH